MAIPTREVNRSNFSLKTYRSGESSGLSTDFGSSLCEQYFKP